ncbi:MAG: T9SS type A sorting domain-containing protein [Flavobacteriia bacterium]
MKLFITCIALFYVLNLFGQAPGSLDPSFATIGYASYGPVASNYMDNAQDIVTLPNGKMVYCGTSGLSSSLGMVVVRLNCNGTIDNTFGTNGYYLYNSPGGSSFAYDLELLPNGQLLVAGATSITAANPRFTMFKLNSDGTLDQTFGVNGFFHNDIGSGEDYARKILIQNNKIILVGVSKVPGFTTNRLALTQCDMNGQLDVSFGTGGTTVFQNATGASCFGQSAVIGNNQDIFICGDAYINNVYYPLLAKVSSTGIPYTSFGSNGVLIPMNFNARFFDIEYDGTKLIMAGQNNVGPWDFLLQARNTTDGGLVTTFGTAGSSIVDVVQADTYYELLIHPDGSLLACGTTGTAGIGAARDFIISKYNSNGIIDNTFGTNGHTITSIGTAWDDAYGMDLYPGNKVVLAGFSAQTNTQHAVARYAYGAATPVAGCMDPLSCNYNCLATVSNGSCLYPNTPCNDGNPLTINDSTDANCNCVGQLVTSIPGCMNPNACNYNPQATVDDGSCLLPGTPCDDNNPNTMNDSINPDCLCAGILIVQGCMDPNSCNYNPQANMDDNTCIYPDTPCDDNNPDTFNDLLDSLCNCVGTLYVSGCMDPNACNYNPLANIDDNSCILPGSPCDDGNTMTINDSLDVNCNCVGIDISGLYENEIQFDIYPNPTSSSFVIETNLTQDKTIVITDLQGKLLFAFDSNQANEVIDCSKLASGTYFVKIVSGPSQVTKKLHVQR